MSELLFVYGSLMPSLTAPFGLAERTRLARESTVLGPATLAAQLYNLGQYPGVVIAHGGALVHGTLLRLSAPERTFEWLDPFEDIEPGRDPAQSLYERNLHAVDCDGAGGRTTYSSWVYVLRRVPPAALLVASGMWHAPSP